MDLKDIPHINEVLSSKEINDFDNYKNQIDEKKKLADKDQLKDMQNIKS